MERIPPATIFSFDDAGVYTVILTITDDDGGEATSEPLAFVVYDPSEGFVTGGGWIYSPEGAYSAAPELAGRATFGFVSKYKKGATNALFATGGDAVGVEPLDDVAEDVEDDEDGLAIGRPWAALV